MKNVNLKQIKKLAQIILTEHSSVVNRYISRIKYASSSVDIKIKHELVFNEDTEAWNISDSLTSQAFGNRYSYTGYGCNLVTDLGKEVTTYDYICPICGKVVQSNRDRHNHNTNEEIKCPKCKTILNTRYSSNITVSGDTIFYTPMVILRIPYSFEKGEQGFYDFCIEIRKPRNLDSLEKPLVTITYIAKHCASASSIIRENYDFDDNRYYNYNNGMSTHGVNLDIDSKLKGSDKFDAVFSTSLTPTAVESLGRRVPSTVRLLYTKGSFDDTVEKSGLAALARDNKLYSYTKALHPDLTLFSRIFRGDFLLEYLIKNDLFPCTKELDSLSSTNVISRKDIMSILKICKKNGYEYPFKFTETKEGKSIRYSQNSVKTLTNYVNYDGTPSEYRQGSLNPLGLYIDYLKLLIEAEKDIKSPRWICPENLVKSHDNMAEKLNKRINEIKLKKVNADYGEFYTNHMKPFENVSIELGDYIITPQMTIEDVFMMGTSFHNCVFNSGYYKNNYSLLLKGYSKASGKYETCIELLDPSRYYYNNDQPKDSLRINQCYGPCNRIPENKDKWMEMLEASIPYLSKLFFKKPIKESEDRNIIIKSKTVTDGEIKIQY